MSIRRSSVAAAAALLAVVAAIAVILVGGGGRGDGEVTTTALSIAAPVTSPYDFSEAASEDADLSEFAQSKFISVTLEAADGFRSYLLDRDTEQFTALTTALAEATETAVPPLTAAPTDPGDDLGPTLTVVMPDRTTYTFVLDTERSALLRAGRAWKTKTDLATLLEQVTQE